MNLAWCSWVSQTSLTTSDPSSLIPAAWLSKPRWPVTGAGAHVEPEPLVHRVVLLLVDALELEEQPSSHVPPPCRRHPTLAQPPDRRRG